MARLPRIAVVLLLLALLPAVGQANELAPRSGYPRILGMNIGGPKYYADPQAQWVFSRHDILILGFYQGWDQDGTGKRSMREVVRSIKAMNPKILVGQYTILGESQDSDSHPARAKARKLTAEGWWLTDQDKQRVRWSSAYGAWDINITNWSRPDRDGLRYPEWLARHDDSVFFKPVPEFDIWYFDNVLARPASRTADWDLDGHDDSRDEPRIALAYRQANVAEWKEARRLEPHAILMGNAKDLASAEYAGRLQGAFLEALMGLPWSTGTRLGWAAAMIEYRNAIRDTASPHIVAFNVHGRRDDYQLMRFGLTSSLLEDGYFSYTELDSKYRTVSWFDEFDANLGEAVDPPARKPWQSGVYRRNFDKGAVLVNPDPVVHTVVLEAGYRRLAGKQDPVVNNGQPATTVRLRPRDGLILLR